MDFKGSPIAKKIAETYSFSFKKKCRYNHFTQNFCSGILKPVYKKVLSFKRILADFFSPNY